MATSVQLLKLFVGRSTSEELAAWQNKELEIAKAESKLRGPLHNRRYCEPTELFPVLGQIRAHLAH